MVEKVHELHWGTPHCAQWWLLWTNEEWSTFQMGQQFPHWRLESWPHLLVDALGVCTRQRQSWQWVRPHEIHIAVPRDARHIRGTNATEIQPWAVRVVGQQILSYSQNTRGKERYKAEPQLSRCVQWLTALLIAFCDWLHHTWLTALYAWMHYVECIILIALYWLRYMTDCGIIVSWAWLFTERGCLLSVTELYGCATWLCYVTMLYDWTIIIAQLVT